MRLTASDRRLGLMDAALQLFSRHGFDGTTTRQIAKRAGVTEAIVFRHFRNKEALYWAVLERQCTLQRGRVRLMELLATSGNDDAAVFNGIAEDILRRNVQHSHLARLLLFSALENHKLSNRFFRTHISSYYEVVADVIRERIRAGRFRAVDPLLAARGFIGMIFYHYLVQELFGAKRLQPFDPVKVAGTMAEIWLVGMAAPGMAAPGTSGRLREASNGKQGRIPQLAAHANGNGRFTRNGGPRGVLSARRLSGKQLSVKQAAKPAGSAKASTKANTKVRTHAR